jgi:hypothetical protein
MSKATMTAVFAAIVSAAAPGAYAQTSTMPETTGTVAYWSQYIQNFGREDATGVKLKLGTIDANTKNTKRLGEDEWVRLGIGASGSSAFLIHKKDYLDFFVTCLSYSDDRDQSFEEVSFYKLPDVLVPNMGSAPILVGATEYDRLSSGFSCAKM